MACLPRARGKSHVRQVEAWGGLFIPVYLLASVVAWWRGGDYYRENYFERDARRACGEDETGPLA